MGLMEAKCVVDFFIEEFCTKVSLKVDPNNQESLCYDETFLKGEIWNTKVYDFQQEVGLYEFMRSNEYANDPDKTILQIPGLYKPGANLWEC